MSKITYIKEIAPEIYDVKVYSPKIAQKATPGQFLHVDCGAGILKRPISICDVEGDEVRFIFAVKGEGTKALTQKSVGDELNILGPLGKGFDLKNAGKSAVVGGGIGTFPLLMTAKQLENPIAVLGFRNKDLVVLEDDFSKVCSEVKIATDDGSYGFHGLVTDLIEDGIETIFACGPKPMLKAVKKVAMEKGIKCQISLEERMGCGIGACVVCVCKMVNGQYLRVCKDGPVFNAEEVDLDD